MNENMTVYEKVRAVPAEALKPINGGRLKGMSDINPMWRIKMLTETFGMCGIGWKTVITDRRLERGNGDEIVCFVDIHLFVKVDGQWSDAIEGTGGSSFVTQERNGLHTSDECFKMAYTDAISVACKSLGFAADVYFAKDRTKYSQQEDREQQQPEVTKGEVKAKWIVLAGNEDGFEEWHTKQTQSGQNNHNMNQFLAQKIMEKKKESA
jgi:hypothetical protein